MSVLLDELTCKPLDTYNEIQLFLQDPPAWRTLCNDLQPHSKYLVKNSSLVGEEVNFSEPGPATFCHFDADDNLANEIRVEEERLPKTLVCHDMANGYHDDCKIDGTGSYDAYTFYNWAGIDIFCYFSHHLITIPPLGWINVGHAHGVKVIGTVITEWAEGQALWDKVLESESEYKNFASALVAIAKTLKFDGWLLNVENKVSKPTALLEFVKHLHKTLHEELKHPVLIWYDSVTVEGTLNWQNALNQRNKPFFDACDGIFTNYSWTVEHVKESSKLAGERITDLYIGVDVWGRNFYGGGQFNTHEAISVAYSYGCSLAIFAQAWTQEAMTFDEKDINTVANAEELDKYEQFLLRDRALWDCIWPYLNTRVPSKLPFKTSFCRGQGKKRRLHGEVLCPVPWYNFRHMQYQPNSSHGPHRYTMTAIGKMQNTSQTSQREKKGIIKIREDIITSKEEIECPETQSINNLDENIIVNEAHADEVDEARKPHNVKRKIKDIFKHIFKAKSSKKDDQSGPKEDDEDENEIDTNERKPDDSETGSEENIDMNSHMSGKEKKAYKPKKLIDLRSSEKSMVWMSININLGREGQAPVTRYGLTFVPEEKDCLQVYFNDSFIGGSCVKVLPCEKFKRTTRLLHCDFFCSEALVFCVVTKTMFGCEKQYLNLKLTIKKANKQYQNISLIGRTIPTQGHQDQSASSVVNIYPINNRSDPEFRHLQTYLLLNEPDFYLPVENSYDWTVRYYKLAIPGSRVMSINCNTGLERGSILLGHFGVCSMTTTINVNEID
ncbi:unnamed protein product [Chilo suppressalis]|uniref:Cytosolic endo-beta-N-acetylglucosaminidase TIM barrel domain-containing protein n=1 Tax=Chilo suppressalis TaxID=168631 RepID=A0ABN8AR63_CHISP|nr:unnamed protein product [Chilo suppressalis]